jgi:DNA-binding MarR family transcriptional regulator
MVTIKKTINASVISHIIKFNETIRKDGDVLTREFGITTQQWLIMLLLANDPNVVYLQENPQEKPLLAKELADALNVSRANITNLLNILIEKQLVKQSYDKEDRRRKRLILTPKGEDIISKLEIVKQEKNSILLDRFTDEEKLQFIAFIDKCLKVLKQDFGG